MLLRAYPSKINFRYRNRFPLDQPEVTGTPPKGLDGNSVSSKFERNTNIHDRNVGRLRRATIAAWSKAWNPRMAKVDAQDDESFKFRALSASAVMAFDGQTD